MKKQIVTEDALRRFIHSPQFTQIVQKNSESYKKKWLKWADKKDFIAVHNQFSWNWAAFIFQEFWLAYRKMYIPFVAVVICRLVILGLTAFSLFPQLNTALNGATIGLTVIIALYGNAWYLHKCLALVEKAQQQFPNDNSFQTGPRKAFFAKNGGTSWAFSLISLLVFCVIIGGLVTMQMMQQTSEQNPLQQNSTEHAIDSVRDGSLSWNSSITLRQALESHPYISHPTWEAFATEQGGHMVRFTAECDFVREGSDIQEKHGHQDIIELIRDVKTVHIVIDFYLLADGTNFEFYQGHMLINGKLVYTGDATFVQNLLHAIYNKDFFILQTIDNIRN